MNPLGLSFGMRILILLIGLPLGFLFLLKPLPIVNTIGKSAWAEAKFPGGTFGAVKVFGIVIIVVSIMAAF